jgi:hypothetical protein
MCSALALIPLQDIEGWLIIMESSLDNEKLRHFKTIL